MKKTKFLFYALFLAYWLFSSSSGVELQLALGVPSTFKIGSASAHLVWQLYPPTSDIFYIRCKQCHNFNLLKEFTYSTNNPTEKFHDILNKTILVKRNSTSFSLVINDPGDQDVGWYICIFNTGKSTDVQGSVQVSRVTEYIQTVNGINGTFSSHDTAVSMIWTIHPPDSKVGLIRCFHNQTIAKSTLVLEYERQQNSISTNKYNGSLHVGYFRLTITKPTDKDQGIYNCTFSPEGRGFTRSDLAQLQYSVILERNQSTGLIIGIIVLAILTVLIIAVTLVLTLRNQQISLRKKLPQDSKINESVPLNQMSELSDAEPEAVKEKTAENKRLQENLEKKETENLTLNNDLEKIQQELENMVGKLREKSTVLKEKTAENQILHEDLERKETEILKLRKEVQSTKNDLTRMQQELENTVGELRGKSAELKEKTIENQRLLENLEQKETENLKLTKEIESKQNDLTRIRQELKNTFGELTKKSTELEEKFEENQRLKESLERREKENLKLTKEVQSKQNDLSKSKEELENTVVELRKKTSEHQKLKDSLNKQACETQDQVDHAFRATHLLREQDPWARKFREVEMRLHEKEGQIMQLRTDIQAQREQLITQANTLASKIQRELKETFKEDKAYKKHEVIAYAYEVTFECLSDAVLSPRELEAKGKCAARVDEYDDVDEARALFPPDTTIDIQKRQPAEEAHSNPALSPGHRTAIAIPAADNASPSGDDHGGSSRVHTSPTEEQTDPFNQQQGRGASADDKG